MERINPQKYVELQEKLQQEAKADAIALLRNKVENHAIVIDDIYKQISDHDWIVTEISNIPIVFFFILNNLILLKNQVIKPNIRSLD